MTLILSGTDGLSDVDGSAATPAIRGTDANTGIFFPAADTIAFSEGGAEIARFDSSGNFGIGTNSPAVKLDINGITGWGGGTTGQTAQIVGTNSPLGNGGNLRVLSNTTQATDVGGSLVLGGYYTTTAGSIDFSEIAGRKENGTAGNTAGYLAFGTRPNAGNMTERMRIDSSGNVFVSNGLVQSTTTNNTDIGFQVIKVSATVTAGTNKYIQFLTNNGAASTGFIASNGASNAGFFAGSDRRIKTDIQTVSDGVEKIMQLKPSKFKFKENNEQSHGFIAQELNEVFPECVYKPNDGLGEEVPEGQEPWAINLDKLVPYLTAAIQEQQALITALTARITALETP